MLSKCLSSSIQFYRESIEPSCLFDREKSVCTAYILGYEVHDAEFYFPAASIANAEEIPLGAPLGIDVILHVEFIGGERFVGFEDG